MNRARCFGLVLAVSSVGFLMIARPVEAHHGKEFLLARTAEVPHPGELFLVSRQDVVTINEEKAIVLESTLLCGVTHWMAFEVHGHAGKERENSFAYESTAPALHLLRPRLSGLWGAGLLLEYEFSHETGSADRMEAVASLSRQAGERLIAVNIAAERERSQGAEPEYGYALGYRAPLARRIQWGLEATGSFTDRSRHDGLFSLFLSPSKWLSLNFGIGSSIGDGGGVSIRSAAIWGLR